MRVVYPIAAVLMLAASATAHADEPISFAQGSKLLTKYGCQTCHAAYDTLRGPSLKDIANKYASDPNAAEELATNVLNGSTGAWGTTSAMAPFDVPDTDLKPLIEWILSLRQ